MSEISISIIVLILMNAIEYGLLTLFFNHYFCIKFKTWFCLATGIVFVLLLTIINLQHNAVLNIVTVIVLVFINALFVFHGNTSKKFAFSLLFGAISSMSEMLVTFLLTILTAMSIQIAVERVTTYLLSGFGGKAILLLILRYLIKKYPRYYELDRGKDIMMLSAFPAAALATSTIILEYDKMLSLPFSTHLLTIGLLAFFLCLSVSIFFVYHSALHKRQLENELKLNEEMKITSIKVFYQQNETVTKISALQHEYMRHLKTIYDFSLGKEYSKLDLYISDLLSESSRLHIPVLVDFDNFALSALYGHLTQQCEACKINFVADIRFNHCAFISEVDANVIFGNLFDNALEACSNTPEALRRIVFIISRSNNFLLVTLVNSKTHDIRFLPDGNSPLSTRRNYQSEGYGIKNIRSTLANYHGYLTLDYSENEFTSVIWLEISDMENN